jgi:hypothetical protein
MVVAFILRRAWPTVGRPRAQGQRTARAAAAAGRGLVSRDGVGLADGPVVNGRRVTDGLGWRPGGFGRRVTDGPDVPTGPRRVGNVRA